jgi:hypothetical protein
MWTVVYIAPSPAAADRLAAVLRQEGLMVTVRPIEVAADGRGSVEILVPDGEAEEAHEVLAEHLGHLG